MAVSPSPPHTPRTEQLVTEPIALSGAVREPREPETPIRENHIPFSPAPAIENSPLRLPAPARENKPAMHKTAEKTSGWAGLCFGVAGLFFCAALYYLYRAGRQRKFYLLIPAGVWLVASTIVGTVGELLEKTGKVETPLVSKREKNIIHTLSFQKGQPVPIDNAGNTCFINAPTQAIMNDAKYPHIFKKICQREIDRHAIFKDFLSLFPPQKKYIPSLPKFLSSQEHKSPQDFAFKNIKDVFIRLMARKGELESAYFDKTKTLCRTKYPTFFAILDLFPQDARSENDFAACANNVRLQEVYDFQTGEVRGALKDDFNKMKHDSAITECFYKLRETIMREIAGFRAYLSLIDAYNNALKHGQAVSFRTWRMSSSIGDVRNLMQNSSGYSQEDVEQFLRCLAKYALPDEYPEIFFSTIREVECQEIEEREQDDELKKVLREHIAKHQKGEKPSDLLSVLPSNRIFTEPAKPECIFAISEALTEGAQGQDLFDKSQKMKSPGNIPKDARRVFIDEIDGQAKLFYPAREKININGTPTRVVLQLGRWKSTGEKINCTVHMPLDLKINRESYRLKSIVVHIGEGLGEGHYTAFVCKNNEWWYTSDNHVDKALNAHVEMALTKGYLYFYEKIEALKISDAAV
jgi:hypothetical protein